jgi:hypothetical protein
LAAGESVLSAAGAVATTYVFGYLVGSLLLERVDKAFGLSWAVIRTVAGLLLTTVGFLLSLALSLPWFVGPVALVAAAVSLRGRAVFAWPHVGRRFDLDGVVAAVMSLIIVSPILLTVFYMARGPFPPVFYNIDTAYALEKVHALIAADTYPPESLSNAGIRRTYHYGTQAMAALISRTSGLLPHHSMFVVVLPLLTAGVLAAAGTVARYISPALPRSVSVPLLLLSIPTLANPFWGRLGRQLWDAVTSAELSLNQMIGEYGLWGILSNEGPNVGADVVILASLAGIAAAPSWGWKLPAFLIGTAILVKTPTGVALIAGFALMEAWRAVVARDLRPSPQALMAGGTFIATAVMFFLVSFESNFRVELYPLFHVREMVGRGNIPGLALDVVWLLLPILIVLSAGITDPERRSAPLLWLVIAPLIVVNATRMDNTRPGGGGTGDDWFQMLHGVPFFLHAFTLSLASRRWQLLGRGRRTAFLLTLALTIGPVAVAAAHYSVLLLRSPESGNDFVDNRSLAEALAIVPTRGAVLVTNDLRYPAGNFTRDYRQMQIPALFGHQAFAVNYAHEAVEERRPLQQLLQQPTWSDDILDAAVKYKWTHFLVHRDYAHPEPIPLRMIFENDSYAVFQFP